MTLNPQVIRQSAASGSLLYPYATYLPIPEATRQAKINPRLLIFHSMAGPAMTSLDALWRYVARDDVHTEPTFILDMAGRMAQLVPANVRADCNAQANGFAGSVETQDKGAGTLPHTPWTPEQVEQLAGLAAWYHLRFDVPLSPPGAWAGSGVGYHSQYSQWSIYTGKTCPGAARIAQMPAVLARARELANPIEEDDVAILMREDGEFTIYAVSGNWRRKVRSPDHIAQMAADGTIRSTETKVVPKGHFAYWDYIEIGT